jgi:hypothetical protein
MPLTFLGFLAWEQASDGWSVLDHLRALIGQREKQMLRHLRGKASEAAVARLEEITIECPMSSCQQY